jgi:hypothetical protein
MKRGIDWKRTMRSIIILYHGFSSGFKAERIIETTFRDQAAPMKTKIFRNRMFLEKIQSKSDFDIQEVRSFRTWTYVVKFCFLESCSGERVSFRQTTRAVLVKNTKITRKRKPLGRMR